MNKVWKKEYYLRASDFDKFNHIKPASVLDLFQDAAGQHAIELGVGFCDMIKRNYLWVLTKIKFKVLCMPKSYQKVVVKTWPLAPNRISYRREYAIENEVGEQLIVGSSEWVVIDSEKRRFVSAPDLYPFTEGFHTEIMCEEKLGKIADFEVSNEPYVVNTGYCDLDVNNHVNNTKYVLDAINPEIASELMEFQIDYRKEVFSGASLNIHHKKQDNAIIAKGLNADGDIMFACKLIYNIRKENV